MEENKVISSHNGQNNGNFSIKSFFSDMVSGFFIGIAFIIPGFSGGSVAAILGIYDRLIGAIADIFRDFKRSVLTLIPIFIGLVIGAVSLLYPLGWALEAFPIPAVSLFVGLAIGGIPSITEKIKPKFSISSSLCLIIPLLIALSMSFLPVSGDVDLLSLNIGGYLLLFAVGALASAALVIPGISGSMILLILGFYNPIVSILTDHFLKGQDMLTSFLVLMSACFGIIVGFIAISMVMKKLMEKYYTLTYIAILGFIIGSLPTVFISTAKEAGYTLATLPTDIIYWVAATLLLLAGIAVSIGVTIFAKKKNSENALSTEREG